MTDRPASGRIQNIHDRLQPLRTALLEHPIYSELDSVDRLHQFMQHHVFAVWDFMSLLSALRGMVCSTSTPWLPPRDAALARFVNEIVLAEETDEDGEGGFASHFELYRRAMRRCGADTTAIDRLTTELAGGKPVHEALAAVDPPGPILSFVGHTFDVIGSGDVCAIAASFTFGREDLLPAVFQRVVDELRLQGAPGLSDFQYYLARHIELDGDQHGPMAERLIASLCEDDDGRWQRAAQAAEEALRARIELWDGMLESIRSGEPTLTT